MPALFLRLLVFCLLISSALAEEGNGLRLTAQKTTLEKEKDRDAFNQWDKVSKALGIKVVAQNISFKDLPEGTLEYIVIVKRWGSIPVVYEKYTGSEKLPALLKGATLILTIGKIPLSGWESGNNRKQFEDTLEAFQIIAKHDGKETLKITSSSSFEKLRAKAKEARK